MVKLELFEYAIGIDIGGTKIAAGIVDRNGEILEKVVYATPQGTRDSILSLLEDIVSAFIEKASIRNIQLVGIGIGTAGQIDFQHGKVRSGTTNIKDWNDVPLRELLSQKFHLPIWVDNDVNTLTLAEQQVGAAKNINDVICLALGTGVGGGVISEGRMVRGVWGGGTELGHITVDMNGPVCNCGFRGCLEVFASGTGIATIMRDRLNDNQCHQASSLYYYKNHPDEVTSQLVFKWLKDGDGLATEVVEKAIHALAYAIVSFIHMFNPSLIVLGGGVLQDGEWFLRKVEEKARTLGIKSLVTPVEFKLAELGTDAGLIGAALQPWIYETSRQGYVVSRNPYRIKNDL